MATRKTKAEAEKVWDSFHKSYPNLNFTVVIDKDGEQIRQIHILQVLKCRVCGAEIKTHAIGQHSGTCHTCTVKRNRKIARQAARVKAQNAAEDRAYQEYTSMFGDE